MKQGPGLYELVANSEGMLTFPGVHIKSTFVRITNLIFKHCLQIITKIINVKSVANM